MNNEYLLRAKEVIPDAKVLIVLASKRAAMLASGKSRPMIRGKNEDSFLDIALLEIAEGKLEAEFGKPGDNDILNELEALKKASQAELEPMKKTPGE